MKKHRVNIQVGEELKLWYEKKAEKVGVSMSAMMAMAMHEYMRQTEAAETIHSVTQHPEFKNHTLNVGKPVKRTK